MKKIYSLFSIICFTFTFSQTYQFDFLTKYSVQNISKNNINEAVHYFNSDDFSYYLMVKKNVNDFTGTILDRDKRLAHKFAIKEYVNKGEIRFQFDYLYSYDLRTLNSDHYRFEFEEIPDKSPKEVIFKIYPNKRAKKPKYIHHLTLQDANKNLFSLYRLSMMHPFEFNKNFNFNGNYIVSKDIMKNKKITCEFLLKEYKNINLEINLPKKLNYKRSAF